MDGTAQPALLPGCSSSNTGRFSNTAAGLSAATTAASSNHTPDTVSQLHSKSRSIQSSWSWDRQVGMIPALSVQPERDSTAAVQSNLISPATSQSTRNTLRRNRTWGSSLFRIRLMLLFMFLSITVTEGVKDWSESPHQKYIPNGILQPRMPSYMTSGGELFSFNKIEWNLIRNQGVWSIRGCYVLKIRDTRLVYVHCNNALAREDDILQHAEVRGPSVRCVLQDQHGIIGYDGVLKHVARTYAAVQDPE